MKRYKNNFEFQTRSIDALCYEMALGEIRAATLAITGVKRELEKFKSLFDEHQYKVLCCILESEKGSMEGTVLSFKFAKAKMERSDYCDNREQLVFFMKLVNGEV